MAGKEGEAPAVEDTTRGDSTECRLSDNVMHELRSAGINVPSCQSSAEQTKKLEDDGALPRLRFSGQGASGEEGNERAPLPGEIKFPLDPVRERISAGEKSKEIDPRAKSERGGDGSKETDPRAKTGRVGDDKQTGDNKRAVGAKHDGDGKPLRAEDLAALTPEKKAQFDKEYAELNRRIDSGEAKPNPKGIVQVYKDGGEIYDEAKLLWAINRPAEAGPPDVSPGKMPFTGPSTVSAQGFNEVLKERGSSYVDARENVRVRREDGSISTVALDMGQLAKLYEVKWREQGNLPMNAGAILAQSEHEINLANLDKLANIKNGAAERTAQTHQWAGIKVGKGTFKCQATEISWGKIADAKWGRTLESSVWADKRDTRVWDRPGIGLCGSFEHIAEKYVANGKRTAEQIIPTYVGAAGGAHYIPGFADKLVRFSDAVRNKK